MSDKYTDLVARAFAEVKAWKFTTFVLAGVCLILAFFLIKKSFQETIVLIPYEVATAKGPVKLDTKARMMNPDYLQYLAVSDLSLFLNWTPKSVQTQFSRFGNRLTSDLYASQNVKLATDADSFSRSTTSQSFYPEGKVKINDLGVAEVDGIVVRWTGEKEILRFKSTYVLKYKDVGGIPMLDNVELKK